MTRATKLPVLAVGALIALLPATSAHGKPAAAAATTTVSVTAGKPSEFRFKLSQTAVTTGTTIFKVANKGMVAHDFKLAGKTTAKLAKGKAGTLRLTFKKPGRYAYLCTLPGHAAAGMKGVLVVKKPVATTVAVTAGKPAEFRFTLSKRTVAMGPLTFKVTNRGAIAHDFKLGGKTTAKLVKGRTATLRVTIAKPGRYAYLCTLPGHAAAGMKGVLVVK